MNILRKIFGNSGIKQGIKQPKLNTTYNLDEFEEYIDPKCGCRKFRKKLKTMENESNVEIQSE